MGPGGRWVPALLAALIALASRPAAAAEPGTGPLPWRVGGDLGFTADAASFPDSAGHRLEVYLRLPPSTLAALAQADSVAESRLRVGVRLRNRFGAAQHEAVQEIALPRAEASPGFGKVVLFRFAVASGDYRLQVKLEDLLSRRRGLAYLGRNVPRTATVEGGLTVPAAENGLAVSSPEFVWSEAGAEAAAFRGADSSGVLPNPERLYGLLANPMRVRFQARQAEPARPWRWRAALRDRDGKEIAVRESSLAASRWLVQDVAIDISTDPAGAYEFELRAWREGDAAPAVRRERLSVAWQRGSWMRNPRDIEDDAHFLLEAEEGESFALMSAGEQERYLEDFWRERDPTPATAANEAREEFTKRVAYANRTWTRASLGKGMFTDMGRVFIRHGEPDETLRQVIPAGDQTLTQLLQQLELTQDHATGDVASKGLGGDVRPFEVWIYDLTRVASIIAKPGVDTRRRTLKPLMFLFVDERGYGDYRLRYSNE